MAGMDRDASDRAEAAEPSAEQVIGIFHDAPTLRAGIDALLAADLDWSRISLLASDSTVDKQLSDLFEEATDVEAEGGPAYKAYLTRQNYHSARTFAVGGLAYVGAAATGAMIVASGGALAAGLVAAAAAGGAGAAVGEALARFMDRRQAALLSQHLEAGGILVAARCESAQEVATARSALEGAGAAEVLVAELPDAVVDLSGGVSGEMSFLNNPTVRRVLGASDATRKPSEG